MSEPNIVEINGHKVDTNVHPAGRFFDGETGEPITDEQWDHQKMVLADDTPDDQVVFDEFAPEDFQ